MAHIKTISNILLEWHSGIERKLPWKEDNNVFYIWLSEIILQQTRVEQGTPYFLRFRKRFKNVEELANISDEELMNLWQGLGYYSRARNLHKAAKIVSESGGNFPTTYEGLLSLPGVGAYTAAAIGSFAYNLPTPVIDGNVKRVISRLFGIKEPIDTKDGKEKIEKALNTIFDQKNPASFNQAIMDFGALTCKPKSPDCESCPFNNICFAYIHNLTKSIPLKVKKIKKQNRTFQYFILQYQGHFLIRKRLENDIWKHLHDFPLLEQEEITKKDLSEIKEQFNLNAKTSLNTTHGPFKHILTHQTLKLYFHFIDLNDTEIKKPLGYFLVSRENLSKFAFPKIIDWFLKENSIYLKKDYINKI